MIYNAISILELVGGGAYGATACGLAGCDKRSRRPQSAFCLSF